MKFQVIFTFDPEYKGYVAEVPELPGCVSQGKTLDEAVENIKNAIRGYLHVLAKHGKTIKFLFNFLPGRYLLRILIIKF
jgi:predicted RNase H-like HicB family nuclease